MHVPHDCEEQTIEAIIDGASSDPRLPGQARHTGAIPAAGGTWRRVRSRGQRWLNPLLVGLLVAGGTTATTAAAMAARGGSEAVTVVAESSVVLTVNGVPQSVSLGSGLVADILAAQGIELSAYDAVSPPVDAQVSAGQSITVQLARELLVEVDGQATTVWTTAHDASAVLASVDGEGRSVRLVASRSGGRLDLPMSVSVGDVVAVVADGHTSVVTYAGGGAQGLLELAGLEVGYDDAVTLVNAADVGADSLGAQVALTVQRVQIAVVTEALLVPYETEEREDGERFRDLAPRVDQEGVDGSMLQVSRVTTVDGEVTDQQTLSQTMVAEPVSRIVVQGTRERPAAAPVHWEPGAISDDIWVALAQCESGGNPSIVSSNGLFHGLYQFMVPTWYSVGGTGLPSQASPEEQRMRAEILQARSGWGQWTACTARLGLR